MEKVYSCPFCKDIKLTGKTGARLFVNEDKGLYYCFKCNKGGKLSDIEHLLTIPVFIKHGRTYDDKTFSKYNTQNHIPKMVGQVFYPYYYNNEVREYVESRIPRLGALRLDLKTDGENIIFQRENFYQVRFLIKSDKKYCSYGKIEPIVINTHKNNTLIVVEGFFDAGYVCRHWNTLITFGCKKFQNMMSILDKFNIIVVAYDKDWFEDPESRIGTEAILKTLGKKYYFYVPISKDICEDGWLAVRKIRELV